MADTTVSVETKLIGAQEVAQGFKSVVDAAEATKKNIAEVGAQSGATATSIDTAASAIVEQFAKASEASQKLKESVASIGAETQKVPTQPGVDKMIDSFRKTREAAGEVAESVSKVGKSAKDAGEVGEVGISKVAIAAGLASAAVAGLAAVAGYAALQLWEKVKASAAYASALYDVHAATGKSAEALQGWDLAAKQSGTTLSEVIGTMNRLTSQLFRGAGTGGPGAGRLRHMLEIVGIDPSTLRDGEDAMMRIADVMRQMTPTDRVTVAQQLGISSGMIQLLSQGSVEIKRLADETNNLRILAQGTVEAQDLLGDSIIRMQTAAMGLANNLLNQFLPTLATMAARWADTLIAMGGAWEAFKTLVLKGLPGGDRFMSGLEAARENVGKLGKELDDLYAKQVQGGNRIDMARRENRIENLRVEINAAKALVAEYERVLAVTTKREEAAQPFVGPPLPPPDPFNRERRGGTDPADAVRETTRKLRITLAELAGEIDASPEAKQYRETIANLSRSFADKDPKNNIPLSLFNEGALAAMDLFVAQRAERLRKMGEQDQEALVRAKVAYAAQQEAVMATITAQEEAYKKLMRTRAQVAEDQADPLGGFLREMEHLRTEFARLQIEMSPEAWQKMQEGVARGFNGMAKEAKEGNKVFDELLRAVEGFGRQFTDSLYDSFERGENVIEAFFANIAKLAAKRLLFETIGRPIDNMIKDLVTSFASNAGSTPKGEASPSFWSAIIPAIGSFLGFGAEGMQIPPGFSAIVGESGHETVTAGAGGLNVQPMGRGESTNYYNITVHSDVDRSRVAYDIQRAIMASQSATREDLYRGGSLSQILATTGRA